mmetsp:Transcript_18617/g.26202  ORF Transcript_18617/g.26202 Transcript_18617/m.26202 type:complete len:175 (-) Transcript_18617:1053-1577(-)
MGASLQRAYVEWTYGKGCPKNGKKVIRSSDFSDEHLAKMSRKDLANIGKSLGIGQPPTTRPKGDGKELSEDVRKFYDSVRQSIHKGETFDHGLWDEILKECVGEGEIRGIPLNTFDYKKLIKKTEGKEGKLLGDKFDAYLEKLGSADLESLSTNNQIAFLMNAYNALCINIIVK